MTHVTPVNVPTESEIDAMAAVLVRRYRSRANEVARHFVAEHEAIGDEVRANLWKNVYVRLSERLAAPTLS